MAKLYFSYAAMNAGKSTVLLQVAHNYAEQGMEAYLLNAALDDRNGTGKISSRIGIQKECDLYGPEPVGPQSAHQSVFLRRQGRLRKGARSR